MYIIGVIRYALCRDNGKEMEATAENALISCIALRALEWPQHCKFNTRPSQQNVAGFVTTITIVPKQIHEHRQPF